LFFLPPNHQPLSPGITKIATSFPFDFRYAGRQDSWFSVPHKFGKNKPLPRCIYKDEKSVFSLLFPTEVRHLGRGFVFLTSQSTPSLTRHNENRNVLSVRFSLCRAPGLLGLLTPKNPQLKLALTRRIYKEVHPMFFQHFPTEVRH
jgi:hypothetical protein